MQECLFAIGQGGSAGMKLPSFDGVPMVNDIYPIVYVQAPGTYTCIIRGESAYHSSTTFKIITGIIYIIIYRERAIQY